ncbi:COP9 signalosome complex subunit 7 [Striga asiatica]|uniref:COP9 signalosome complex subunit 7 n=1 Tax=Striga asiatica TaxID=4170 RepID=A0A5A7QRD4_STRAF|nr:COP9 signalosome complex subunit 7 [Striga asiatica]
MDIEEKQAEHVEFFVKQASRMNGAALSNVVVEATKHPSLFAFSEILAVPSILEVCCDRVLVALSLEGTENSIFLDLLTMFAHGTWSEYKTIANRLPQLVPEQVLKLKQLTVLTLADTNKVLPYDMLMRELDVSNVRELEDFLINDCMYVGIIRGKLDQLRRCFEVVFSNCVAHLVALMFFRVQFAAGRDLRPGQLGNMIQVLANWSATSESLLVSIQEKIKWADNMAEMDKKHREEIDERVEEVRKTLSLKVS